MNLALLENQDYEKMAQDILETSKTKSEDELFEILGNALYDSGLEISPEDYEEATIPISFEADTKQFNVFKTLNYVANSEPVSSKNSKGKRREVDETNQIFCLL